MVDGRKEFLKNRDVTGKEVYFFPETGKRYYVEYLGGRSNWGDVNPATGKVEGNYGTKYPGSIKEDKSVITKENGFNDIHEGKGASVGWKIQILHDKWKKENGYG